MKQRSLFLESTDCLGLVAIIFMFCVAHRTSAMTLEEINRLMATIIFGRPDCEVAITLPPLLRITFVIQSSQSDMTFFI